jgi:hypothetical protein
MVICAVTINSADSVSSRCVLRFNTITIVVTLTRNPETVNYGKKPSDDEISIAHRPNKPLRFCTVGMTLNPEWVITM